MSTPAIETWSVVARNNPEHARNPIHTDAGAQAAGFPRALVAGVTTYAYLTHPIVVGWGVDWLAHGGAEVRFLAPVSQDSFLQLVPTNDGDDVVVEAFADGTAALASLRAVRSAGPPPALRAGEQLRVRELRLEGEYGSDYGLRAGDDLDMFARLGVVHPAVWPALANYVVHRDVARGSWIHTRSIVRHHATAPAGATATITSAVVERFDSRAGERAVLDVRIDVDGVTVATLEHHAIVALPGAAPRS